jgi:glycerophosphoryl diester phosphodiesterase
MAALSVPAWGMADHDVVYHHDIRNPQCCLMIAHAAGGIDGNAYTNSVEALQANLAMGTRVFEIDFSKTRDGVWVATHDWENWARQTGYAGTVPTFTEFRALKLKHFGPGAIVRQYTPLTLEYLEQVVARHPDIRIVTDTKYDFREMVRILNRSALHRNLIYQAYSFEDVDFLVKQRIRGVILTVYKMQIPDIDRFVAQVNAISDKIIGLTMPVPFFDAHSAKLAAVRVPVYLHGSPSVINSRQLHSKMRHLGAKGFYLD